MDPLEYNGEDPSNAGSSLIGAPAFRTAGALPDDLTHPGLSVATFVLPFEKPNRFNKIPNDLIKSVSMYMPAVIFKATPGRDVNVEGILLNTKALFTDGKNYYDKDYWMQHCASSLREILVFVEPQHFRLAQKNIPEYSDPSVEKLFSFLMQTTNYFSSIVHHRVIDRMGDVEKIYPGQGYGQMSKDDFLKNEAECFERISIDLVYTLNYLFTTYCSGSSQ